MDPILSNSDVYGAKEGKNGKAHGDGAHHGSAHVLPAKPQPRLVNRVTMTDPEPDATIAPEPTPDEPKALPVLTDDEGLAIVRQTYEDRTKERPERIFDKHGDAIREVHAKHAHMPPVLTDDGPPAPDYLEDVRAVAKLWAFLANDTPERAAILEAAGLPPDSVPARKCAEVADALLNVADHIQTSACDPEFPAFYAERRNDGKPRAEGLNTRRLSDVVARDVEWLWSQRVPLGKLSLITGDPEVGKTWLALGLLARVTTGRDFPDSPNPFGDRRNVLWLSAEDDDEDTIKPRFETLGGDCSRFFSFTCVFEPGKGGGEMGFALDTSLHRLDEWLTNHRLVKVVVFDPLSAYFGKANTNRDNEVRRVLDGLRRIAAKHRVAVVALVHLNKDDQTSKAIYRVMGSVAFVAEARASWLVSVDPKDATAVHEG